MARSALMVGTSDGTRLVGQRWTTDAEAKGAVVLAHGMGEHSLRYDALGKDLAAAGYDLLAVDHRGHGRTAGIAGTALGDFGDAGWDGVVADYALTVRSTIGERPELPVIALGHSMGSWIVQQYLLEHAADVAGAVLSGSGALDLLAAAIDPDAEVDLSAFNAPFAPARTDYDWLSRDEAEVDAYVAEPLCGFGLDVKSAAGMWAAAPRLATPSVPAGFPLLVLAGTADPVNAGLTVLEPVVQRYRDAGAEVTTRYYEEARHEVFNETNRDEVVADLVSWLDGVCAR
ncbi:alpha/beta fold hydrolase [Pseudonocardia dioxanivorans]|uniref:Alpha/beta hydrolase fold protein n=1 Tax=Pseudonocardia dioxanivorans (strain ATCC 55486 / DSM 44775 / JCM 13855 / CB1190) TaxID=675635 RepID=F4CYK8_PSEUX|nr:alpha/beta fold hydrolase [Pseudonocardia dioxanivorans]AEA26578.1 alpha/beta hydrolase fold protein [Pseudonocardia dioxanivorans CB1190]